MKPVVMTVATGAFESAHRLLEDFFAEVDRVIEEAPL